MLPDTFTKIHWASKAPSPIWRAEALTATINGKIYVFGGFDNDLGPVTRSDVYTPATDSWARIADLPERITHAGVAVDGHDVYIVGGYIGFAGETGYGQVFGSQHVWRYNTDTNTFSLAAMLPAQFAGGGSVIIDRQLHYFGGFDINRRDIAIHISISLNNLSGPWTTLAPMTKPVNHMAYVDFDGRIYAIAGQTGTDEGLITQKDVEIYNPATDAWTLGAQMPAARSHISSATFVMGDRIIVLGGESANELPKADAYAYSPATNSWQTLTPLPGPRFSGVAGLVDGKIYFTTGGSASTFEGAPEE
jgi:N-acetylneuraminic acid mutarotase